MTGAGNQPAESNLDYISGARGIVTGSRGQSVDLSMAGLKGKAVKAGGRCWTRLTRCFDWPAVVDLMSEGHRDICRMGE